MRAGGQRRRSILSWGGLENACRLVERNERAGQDWLRGDGPLTQDLGVTILNVPSVSCRTIPVRATREGFFARLTGVGASQ